MSVLIHNFTIIWAFIMLNIDMPWYNSSFKNAMVFQAAVQWYYRWQCNDKIAMTLPFPVKISNNHSYWVWHTLFLLYISMVLTLKGVSHTSNALLMRTGCTRGSASEIRNVLHWEKNLKDHAWLNDAKFWSATFLAPLSK